MAAFCYRQFFPSPYQDEGQYFTLLFISAVFFGFLYVAMVIKKFCADEFFMLIILSSSGWGPYAYFRALEETRSNSSSASTTNAPSVQVMEAQNVSQPVPGQNVIAFGANNYTSLKMDEMESGRS